MLLLLLMGGGQQPGERAYASVSYSNVGESEASLSLAHLANASLTLTTEAQPSEE